MSAVPGEIPKDSDHDWFEYGVIAPLFICKRCFLQKYEGEPEYGGLSYFKEPEAGSNSNDYEHFETIPRCKPALPDGAA